MPVYPYVHPLTGERREIVATMKNAPPEEVLIWDIDGKQQWMSALTATGERSEYYEEDEKRVLYKRDRLASQPIVSVRGDAGIQGKGRGIGTVVSKSLPLDTGATEVRSLAGTPARYNPRDRTWSNMKGERIIRNGTERKRHLKALGMEDVRD